MGEIFKIRKFCASCTGNHLETIWEFGDTPLAGYFPKPSERNGQNMIPMTLIGCSDCGLVQILQDISDSWLFKDYRYISSIGMAQHFLNFGEWFESQSYTDKAIEILEIGCNDGPLLEVLRNSGYNPIGIDPALNIVKIAHTKGLNVINDFFSIDTVNKYSFIKKYDVVISCNSFAHISEIRAIAEAVSLALKNTGHFIVEVQSIAALLESKAIDFIYHEHKYYYSIQTLSNLMKQFGLHLVDGSLIETHGGSYRLVFVKGREKPSLSIEEMIRNESNIDLTFPQITKGISNFIETIKSISDYLNREFNSGKRIIAFGASGRGNILLHNLNISNILKYVLDESPERVGRLMALSGIPVEDFSELDEADYDICIILAWNYSEAIQKKWHHKNKLLITPLPQMTFYRT